MVRVTLWAGDRAVHRHTHNSAERYVFLIFGVLLFYDTCNSAKRTTFYVEYLNRCRIEHSLVHVYAPDDLLIWSDLEEGGAIGYTLVDEPVADYRIAVGKTLDTADPVELHIGQILLSEMPDGFIVRIDFDDAAAVADYSVAISQSSCAKGQVRDFDFSYQLGGRIVLSDNLIVEKAGQVVAVCQFACMSHSHVRVGRRFDRDNLDDLSFTIDLDETIGRTLGDQRISIGQPLATPYFAGSGIFPDYFLIGGDFSSTACFARKAHQDIAVFEHPGVGALICGVLPLDLSGRGYLEDALGSDVTAKIRMLHRLVRFLFLFCAV